MKKRMHFFCFFSLLALWSLSTYAQTKTVSGTVTDTAGAVIAGASVKIQGSSHGTITNMQGAFTLSANVGDHLIISYVNYKMTEIIITNEETYNIQLIPIASDLGDVVVTALGIKRNRNEVPFASQTISGDDVSKNRSFDVGQSMSGKVAGLQVSQSNTMGGSTNIVMRGYKSMTGDNQALFVIDGVPVSNTNTNTTDQQEGYGGYDYGNPASDLNPDDIESITVLKSAAATALYGSRASNGVILITTKKGTDKLNITFNIGVNKGFIDKSTFPKYQNEYGAGYGEYYGPDGDAYFNEHDVNGKTAQWVPFTEDASYGAKFDPNLMVYGWDALDSTSPYYMKARPWVAAKNGPETFFVKPWSNSQSVMVSNAFDKGTYKLGYTRDDENGILPNSNMTKNIINFGATYKIIKNLQVGANVNYFDIDALGRYGTGYSGTWNDNPMTMFRQWFETNVDVKELKDAYFRTLKNTTWNWADYSATAPIFWNNPYFSRYQSYESDHRKRVLGNISLDWTATDWLSFNARASLDQYNWLQEQRVNVGAVGVSGYTKYLEDFYERNFDFIANFHKSITHDLDFHGLIGTNLRHSEDKYTYLETNGGLSIPGLYSLSNSVNPLVLGGNYLNPNALPSEYDAVREVNGIYGSASFSYKKLLTLDATLRRDVSSTLPKGENAFYYPSVALGFVFSELLKNTPWISYGKLSANYAEVGADAPPHVTIDNFRIDAPIDGRSVGNVPTTKNNPNLKPERTRSKEINLEMQFLQNRVGFTASYYSTESIDQILPVRVSSATGYLYEYLNAGTMTNKGFELTLKGTPIKTNDVQWDITLNWSANRNRVTKLFKDASGEESKNLQLAAFQDGVTLNATLGQAYGTLRGSDFVYTNGQKTVDATGHYIFSDDNNQVIGGIQPDWIGGISNSLTVKNFMLSFLVDFKHGGKVFSLDQDYGQYDGLYPNTAGLNDLGNPSRSPISEGGGVILPGVTADGKPNTIRIENDAAGAAYGNGAAPNAGFLYDASFIKLREVELGYNLPQSIVSKIKPFKEIQLSLIGRNLWIIHKNLPYADPEAGTSFGNISGFQSGVYPTERNIGVNLKVRF